MNRRIKATLKILLLICAAIAVIFAVSCLIDDDAIEQLKHHLSLWSIIGLIILINLISFLCFLVMSAAYRWVKRDLKCPADQEQDILD